MDTLRVQTAENVSLGYSAAGLGSRMTAQLLDNLLAGVMVFVTLVVGFAIAGTASSQQGFAWGAVAATSAAFFVYFAYFLVSEAVSGGRTLGKAALGLRVLRIDGSAADFGALAVRNVVRIVDVGVLAVGIIVMFAHPLSRRLGDLAAGTVVVRERANLSLAAAAAPPPVLLRTPEGGPQIDGLGRIGRREHEAVRVFLQRQGLDPVLRARLASDIARRLCDRMQLPASAPERFWPPELFLERLYLQLEARG